VRRLSALSLIMLLISGCAVGPTISDRAPTFLVPTVEQFRKRQRRPAAESLGDEKWWEVFQDKQLQDLIHTASSRITMFALRQRESCKLRPRWASRGPTGCPRLVPELGLSINALRAKNSSLHSTQALTRWISHWLGSRFLGKVSPRQRVSAGSLLATQWAREAVIARS